MSILRSGIGSHDNSIFNFLRNHHTILHSSRLLYIPTKSTQGSNFSTFLSTLFFFFLSWATLAAYVSSQGRSWIGAAAAGLCHNHTGSKLRLQTIPGLTATPDPQPPEKGQDLTCILMDPSRVCYCWATTGTPTLVIFCFDNSRPDVCKCWVSFPS